ncbi:toll/interleukin-1 receptor domain-containing protein [Candidatus Poribacteria bacterium]|nr:toll/interleukin-1 receptor domain-containing protein [Candidatus Poribacteria bacterium]
MKSDQFCESCQGRVSRLLDNDQMIAIKRIISIISDICHSEDPKKNLEDRAKIINGIMSKIFLSHSSADKDFVERLANDLVNNDYRVWFDKWEIKIGDNIVEQINSGISESDYLAFIISKSSVESRWVINEWTAMFVGAVNQRSAKILPILIEDCEIPPILRSYRYADFRDHNSYQSTLKELIRAIS